MNVALDKPAFVRKFEALSLACRDARLSRSDLGVLAVLLDTYNVKRATQAGDPAAGATFKGGKTVAEEAGVHRVTVFAAARRLEQLGYLKCIPGTTGRSTRYVPALPENMPTSSETTTSGQVETSSETTTPPVAKPLLDGPKPVVKRLHKPLKDEPLKEPLKKKRARAGAPAPVDLPDWLDADVWAMWIADRKERGKPMTMRAQALAIKTLAKLRDEGHSPQAVIDKAIERGWQGLFAPPKERSSKPAGQLASDFDESKYRTGAEEVA